MAKLWGVPGFRFVSMPHPIANLSAEGVAQRADALTEKVIALLREGQPT